MEPQNVENPEYSQGVEDILFNSESIPSSSREAPMPRGMETMSTTNVLGEPHSRRFVWVLLVAIIIVASGTAGWKAMKMIKTDKNVAVPEIPELPPAPLRSLEPLESSLIQPIVPQEVALVDTDNDGLTDAEENDLGTDYAKADTDNDGLSDFEEAEIWFTDPLVPDTDNDSYLDGDEVKHGYNPKGVGRL